MGRRLGGLPLYRRAWAWAEAGAGWRYYPEGLPLSAFSLARRRQCRVTPVLIPFTGEVTCPLYGAGAAGGPIRREGGAEGGEGRKWSRLGALSGDTPVGTAEFTSRSQRRPPLRTSSGKGHIGMLAADHGCSSAADHG